MKYLNHFVVVFIALTVMCSCGSKSSSEGYQLTAAEKAICDSLHIDENVVKEIRKKNASRLEPFHYSLGRMIEKDGSENEIDPMHHQGLVFDEENSKSYGLIFDLKDELKKKGYIIFLLENNFDLDKQPDRIGVLKTTDQYEVLRLIQTDGINFDIDNDSLLKIVRQFDKEYALELISAFGDGCEFLITKEPNNWHTFAEEVYKVCPDVVDQGTGTVEALATEMKRTKRLYFWWD